MPANPIWSDELLAQFNELTPKQAAAIPRLAAHLAHGYAVDSLLHRDAPICSEQTYYGRPDGWVHQPAFQEALATALREYRQALFTDVVKQARTLLFGHVEEALERTIQIMRQTDEVAQARLAARDLWREALKKADEDPSDLEDDWWSAVDDPTPSPSPLGGGGQ